VLLSLYKALVRPHLEYANCIWCPFLKRQSVAIERVQRRATKLFKDIKDLSYKERLVQLGLPSLKYRRVRGDLIQLYKIINNVDDISFDKFFTFNTNITINSDFKLNTKYSRTNLRKYTYSNRVVKHWNILTLTTKRAPSVDLFKCLLDKDSKRLIMQLDYDE